MVHSQRGELARRAGVASTLLVLGACSSDEADVDMRFEPSSPVEQGASPSPPTDGPPPAPGEYAERAPLLAPNSEMAVAEVGGKIYVLGGYPSSRDVQTTVQVYDPAANAWSLAAPMPLPTHHPVAVGFEGKIFSLGGQLEGDVNTERAFALDVASDAWTELAPLPTPRGGGAAARIDDRIYVVGGRPPAGNAFEAYDVSDDAWTVLPNLPFRSASAIT